MALPRNNVPTFELNLPSTGKKVTYRPWLVGEQKVLLMALQGGERDILNSVMNTVDACTFNKLDVINMPNFDLEYLFLQIRTKSAGESVDLVLTCQHCEHKNDYHLNLPDVEVQHTEGHTKKILLAADLGVEMQYPTTEQLNRLNKNYSVETVFETICACIETVFTDEEVKYAKDETMEEIEAFVDSLTTEQLDKIEDFFRTMPIMRHVFQNTCSACGNATEYTLEGLESFFA